MKRLRVIVSGQVQGVGFRYWTAAEAERRGLEGWVRNRRDGTVEAVFQGDDELVDDMLRACRSGPRGGRVTDLDVADEAEAAGPGFSILPTR